MTFSEDYLWDRSGTPDPVTSRLEDVLSVYRMKPAPPRRRRVWLPIAAAAAAVIAVIAGSWMIGDEDLGDDDFKPSPYHAALTRGVAFLGGRELSADRLQVGIGEKIETEAGSEVALTADDNKWLTVGDPNQGTVLRVDEATDDSHKLFLQRGRITALIGVDVKPELFKVDTPAGLAVDLGCEDELVVDEDGRATLEVNSGIVQFRVDGRTIWVPRGYRMSAPQGQPLGPPVIIEEESETFRARLRDLLEGVNTKMGSAPPWDPSLVDPLLTAATSRDTLTLWHLYVGAERGSELAEKFLDRLTDLEPMPLDITMKELREHVPQALASYRRRMTGGY